MTDSRDEKIGYKVREARQKDRVPYMLILGAKECAEQIVSVRSREDRTESMTTEDFIKRIKEEIAAYQ